MKSFDHSIRLLCVLALGLWSVLGFGQMVIYEENFTGQDDKGAVGPTPTIDLTGVDWNIDISSADLSASTDWFQVVNEVFEARDIDGDAIWLSPSISITGYTNVSFTLDATESGTMEASDILDTEYRVDGGAWISAAINGSQNDDFTSSTVEQTGLSGNNLEIRVTMNNNAGSEYHRLDNIEVIGTTSGPTILLSETSISGLSYEDGSGGPSAEQTFMAEGSNLTDDITLTAPGNFEISTTSGSGFGGSVILTQSGGTVSPTTIYVRLAASLALNNYSGTLTAVSTGATQQDIALSGSVFIPIFEDFNDGDFTANPIWTGDTSSFSVITDATIPNGNASTDGLFLASNASQGDVSLAVESTETKEWRFSLATPDFDPSSQNYFGIVLMSSNPFSGAIEDVNTEGYYISIGFNGNTDDFIKLWRKDGTSPDEFIGDFPSSPNFDPGALRDGLDIRITRNNSGEFELFYATGFDYVATPTTSAGILLDNTYTTSNYFGVFQNFNTQSSTRRVYLDNIELGNPNIDDDSTVLLPSSGQIASSVIQADATTSSSNSEPVLSFNVSDSGTSDGVATQISQLRFVPGASNTALWSQVIQGIRIERNSFGIPLGQGNQNPIISDSEIIIDIIGTPTQMTVADGVSEEFTISVFLNTTGITDQQVLQFEIESVATGWDALSSGSQFQDTFTNVIGNTHIIDVVGSSYEFITQPVTSILNQPMGLNVQVAFADPNGNIDTSFSGTVNLISTGTLSAAIPSQSAVNGIATFPAADIVHTVLGTSFVLEATSATIGFPSPLTSNTFDIVSTPELFITEVSDPNISGGEEKFVEIYNAGVNPIDLNTTIYFLTREANAGANYESNQLTGSIEAKGYYILSQLSPANFNTAYGIESNIQGTLLGNGNDSYYLSTAASGSDSNVAISTLFDIYGQVGINGFTNDSNNASSNAVTTDDTEWEYEDSRAYRLNPDVKNANSTWTSLEWFVDTDGAVIADMTPGYGDNDYVYDGAWNNIGLGDPNADTPTEFQNIFIKSDSIALTQDTTIGDLVVRENAILTVMPNIKLTVHGDIVNEGTIIFKSNDTSTAVLEAVQPNTRVVGNGFEIHRRIPVENGVRAFRYLSSSVTTTSSIRENWQEGATTTSDFSNPYSDNNFNPNPSFGTHITGQQGLVGTVNTTNGFDETSAGNASMYTYDPSLTEPWQSVSNTNSETFSVGDAYAILIRGDRSSTLESNEDTGPSTTLRTTGQIHIGDFPVPNLSTTDDHFNLVGNPYQSQVDLQSLLSSSIDIDESAAYVWDPNLGSLGGYAVIDLTMLSVSTEIDFGETTPNTSEVNQYLQPQQAFFVQTDGPSPSITFTEMVKNNDEAQTDVFSQEIQSLSLLDLSLKSDNGKTYDGVRLIYDESYSNTLDDLDAVKFWNYTDNLSVYSNNSYLSVEKRKNPISSDTTKLYLNGLTLGSYKIDGNYYSNDTSINVYLKDKYTSELTQIISNTDFSYSFSIDVNVPDSFATDRFEIVYSNSTLSLANNLLDDILIYPNPLSNSEFLKVKIDSNIEIEKLELLNLNGQVLEVKTKSDFNLDENILNIEFKNHLAEGLYLLRIITKREIGIFKLKIE